MQKQISYRHHKLSEKLKLGKSRSRAKSTIIREITGEKNRILTVALYNDIHNRLILYHT